MSWPRCLVSIVVMLDTLSRRKNLEQFMQKREICKKAVVHLSLVNRHRILQILAPARSWPLPDLLIFTSASEFADMSNTSNCSSSGFAGFIADGHPPGSCAPTMVCFIRTPAFAGECCWAGRSNINVAWTEPAQPVRVAQQRHTIKRTARALNCMQLELILWTF
jgi:hypothetical protein